MDVQLPVGCGDVTVYPGDLIVGDGDGVVVVPQHMADGIVTEAVDVERQEVFQRKLVEEGASVNDVHPLSEKAEAQYEEWRKSNPF